MALVALLLGALALTVLRSTLHRQEALVSEYLGGVVLTEELRTASNQAARKARDFVLTGNPEHLPQLEASRARFRELWRRLHSASTRPEERALLERVLATWNAAGAAANRGITARQRTGEPGGETERLVATEMLPQRVRFDEELDALTHYEHALYESAQHEANAAAARAWWLLTTGFLGTAGAALALGVLVVRALRQRERAEAERRAMEERRAELLAELQRTAELRELFVSILGHDLRNPLNAISLSAHSVLTSRTLPERERKAVQRVASSAQRMNQMIAELLDISRIRLGGGIHVEPRPMDLAALCHEMVEELGASHPQAHVTLEVRGDARGDGDAGRIAQVVSNLVGNALQHSPPGTPVRVTVDGQDADAVVLEVHNGGPPISAELLPRLFEPFHRAPRPHGTRAPQGLGLGLYIAQQLVLAHGGVLRADSSAEAGTTFTMRLPRRTPGARGGAPS